VKAVEYKDLTEEQKKTFSLNRKIPFSDWYLDEANIDVSHLYTEQVYRHLRGMAKAKQTNYYGKTDEWLYQALSDFPIEGKTVLIIGTLMPWYESIAIEHGCKSCTVVEYRKQECDFENIEIITPSELGERKFDCVFSISSYEHDGLGRYGEPINPNGDLESMEKIKKNVKDGGIMYLAVPMGKDETVWNAHRVYGKIRLPLLIEHWELISKYGVTDELWDTRYGKNCPPQPVLVLRNK
jgi:hypothetical protein